LIDENSPAERLRRRLSHNDLKISPLTLEYTLPRRLPTPNDRIFGQDFKKSTFLVDFVNFDRNQNNITLTHKYIHKSVNYPQKTYR